MTVWLTTAQTAARLHRDPSTVRLAAGRGQLHGHQRCFKGRWLFHPDAVDAYVLGLDERAQRNACCAHLRALTTRSRT